MHVAIVDDNASIAQMLKMQMEMRSFDSSVFECGPPFLKAVESGSRFDIVLLDYMMPEMDGLAVFQQLQLLHVEVPVIMITAASKLELAVTFMRMGGADFEIKPVLDYDILEQKIRRATRYHQLRNELARVRRRHDALSDISPVGIFFTDLKGHLLAVNQKFRWMADVPATTAADDIQWQQSIHPLDRVTVRNAWQRLIDRGDLFSLDFRFLADDGRVTWVLGQGARMVDGHVGILTDVTNLKRVEAELVTAKEVAEQARSAKVQLLRNTTHELKTPLAVIIGFADYLKQALERTVQHGGPPDKRILEYTEVLAQNARILERLIDDLLDMHRMEAGHLKLKRERICLTEIIHAVAMGMRPQLTPGVQLRIETPREKMSCDRCLVYADPERIKQVVGNLLKNAIRFTQQGEIVMRTLVTPEGVTFSITDSGIGIPSEMHENIFDAFVQVDASDTRASGGAGLGLSICRSIIELHGGRIFVHRSELGRGSEFRFVLPCDLAEGGQDEKSADCR